MLAQQLGVDAAPIHSELGTFKREAAGHRTLAAPRADLHRRRHAITLVLDADAADIPRRVVIGDETDALVDRLAIATRQHAQPQQRGDQSLTHSYLLNRNSTPR
ncbi:hypothetical protein D3C87_1852020 [compost metagenome]